MARLSYGSWAFLLENLLVRIRSLKVANEPAGLVWLLGCLV